MPNSVLGVPIRYDVSITSLIGFLVMFTTVVASWVSMKEDQKDMQEWQAAHSGYHDNYENRVRATTVRVDERLASLDIDMRARSAKEDQLEYRVAQLEEAYERMDARMARMAESTGNNFTEIRAQLNTIAIQIALANDALKRVEKQQ